MSSELLLKCYLLFSQLTFALRVGKIAGALVLIKAVGTKLYRLAGGKIPV